MSWEQRQMVSTTSNAASPKRQRNVGVLEVKMKQRLQSDRDSVAIGMRHHPDACKTRLPPVGGHKKPQKLPKLHANASASTIEIRPPSFETEREQVMEALQLSSPTRSLIAKHVQHTKESAIKAQAALPPISGIFKAREPSGATASLFPLAYRRNELPIMVEPKPGGKTLRWTQDINLLDFSKYFPLFIEGMREREYPFSFLAREGAFQLAAFGREHPEKVIDSLHRLVPALRANLEMHDTGSLFLDTLGMIQQLTLIHGVGPMLVPYYRQLLPVLNLFKSRRRNLGDSIDFKQRSAKDVGEAVRETLELLEKTGGEDAYVNIKYMVPTYEGCGQ